MMPAVPKASGIEQWLLDRAKKRGTESRMQEVFLRPRNVTFHGQNRAEHLHSLFNGPTDTMAANESIPVDDWERRVENCVQIAEALLQP